MATSQKQLLLDGLATCGWVRDYSAKTTKYQAFIHPTLQGTLLVGKSGALRRTTTTVANSVSLSDHSIAQRYREIGRHKSAYSSAEQAVSVLYAKHPV